MNALNHRIMLQQLGGESGRHILLDRSAGVALFNFLLVFYIDVNLLNTRIMAAASPPNN